MKKSQKYIALSIILLCVTFTLSAFVSPGVAKAAEASNGMPAGQVTNSEEPLCVEGRITNVNNPIDPQDVATKDYVDNAVEGVESPPVVLQTLGESETAVMSQKAVTEIISSVTDDFDASVASINQKVNELKEKQVYTSSGTWTPIALSTETAPTYSVLYRYAKYYRINNLVYITFHMKIEVTNSGSGYARIGGLPFKATTGGADGQGLALHELGINGKYVDNACGYIIDGSNIMILAQDSGMLQTKWENGTCWIGFSGCYITDDPINDISNILVNQNIFDAIYPVGSIYMSMNSVNPSALFGGEWEPIQDRFLLSSGGTYNAGEIGGEATHKLTTSEMPSHSHKINDSTEKRWSMENGAWATFRCGTSNVVGGDIYTKETGGNQAHNNMPPYLVVYMWKRTA